MNLIGHRPAPLDAMTSNASAAELWTHHERALRSLLWRVRPRRLERGVRLLLAKSRRRVEEGLSDADALADVYRGARLAVLNRLQPPNNPDARRSRRQEQRAELLAHLIPATAPLSGPDFHCDAALGGLARWLRAAGYEAEFWPGIDDDALLRKMPHSAAILLTTDRRLCERGVIEAGGIAALLVSIAHTKRQQFADVMERLDLPIRPPRCMACGGELSAVEKEAVRERIPPRTYPWRDDYWLCCRCGRLFWEGSHWERIGAQLREAGKRLMPG
jgi:uncharacterized protein with PIN domain